MTLPSPLFSPARNPYFPTCSCGGAQGLIPYYGTLSYIIISVLPKGKSFTANSGTKTAILPKGRSSTANSGTQVAVLLGMDRCGNFPLLSTPHALFSIWTDLKRSEKITGAPTRRWGEWILLTRPYGLHRNSPQGLNISSIRVFDQIRDPEIPITLLPLSHNIFFSVI